MRNVATGVDLPANTQWRQSEGNPVTRYYQGRYYVTRLNTYNVRLANDYGSQYRDYNTFIYGGEQVIRHGNTLLRHKIFWHKFMPFHRQRYGLNVAPRITNPDQVKYAGRTYHVSPF